jgi:phosphoglycerol geranylgeranyltransferase
MVVLTFGRISKQLTIKPVVSIMKVWNYIDSKIRSGEKLHMTLIDPDKQKPAEAGEMARAASEAGSDAIMVGGSTAICTEDLDETVKNIKELCKLPVILFPTTAACLSKYADAIYFMSMLNSRSTNYLIGEHLRGAPIIKKIGLEPIPMGYVVVEPGMKVGEVGEAKLLARDDVADARAYALVAEFFGMNLVYFEAGSGAPVHVRVEMVKEVSESVSIPVIIGGGIRSAAAAAAIAEAGADIVVTGTLVEETEHIKPTLEEIVTAIKRHSKRD